MQDWWGVIRHRYGRKKQVHTEEAEAGQTGSSSRGRGE